MYNVELVAEIFLSFAQMTHKKLQKLCYYAQAYHLAVFGVPLIDTSFEAWIHGPVSPELYKKYKKFGFGLIPTVSVEKFNTKHPDYIFIRDIYNHFGNFNAYELEQLTHKETPWIEARKKCSSSRAYCQEIISEDIMKEFYKTQGDLSFLTVV